MNQLWLEATVRSGLYPRYALKVVKRDNSHLLTPDEPTFHVFLAEGSGTDRDSTRFVWLRRSFTEKRNLTLYKLNRDDIFHRLVPFKMHMFTRNLRKRNGQFDVPHVEYAKPQYDSERHDYRSECKKVVAAIHNKWRIDAIVCGSANDYWCREAIVAARELHIPWIVADRESVVSPVNVDNLPQFTRRYYPFEVDLFLAGSSDHARFYEALGIHKDRIRITGEPKSDFWFRTDLWPSRATVQTALQDDKVLLLYFAFGPMERLGRARFPHEERNWSTLATEHENVLTDLATRYPDQLQIVWKTREPPNNNAATQLLERHPGLTNIVPSSSVDPAQELMVNADIIVGFQTTALIEAMFTSKPIIYAGWGQLHDDVVDRLLPLHKTPAAYHATSAEDMSQFLQRILDEGPPFEVGKDILAARKEFRERYFHKADGNASIRVLDEIQAFLEETSQQDPLASPKSIREG